MAILAGPSVLNQVIAQSADSLRAEPFGEVEAPELFMSHLSPMEQAILQLIKSMRRLTGVLMMMSRARAVGADDFMRGWGDDL